jgi:hypothetical protein
MTAFLFVAAYIIGWGAATMLLQNHLTEDSDSGNNTELRIADAALALIGGALWPLLIPVMLLARRRTPADRRRELDAREARIQKMEHDLGITPAQPWRYFR